MLGNHIVCFLIMRLKLTGILCNRFPLYIRFFRSLLIISLSSPVFAVCCLHLPLHTLQKLAHAIYREVFQYQKFHWKNFDIFNIFAQNIDCGYTLEWPRRGGSNEYPQSMF